MGHAVLFAPAAGHARIRIVTQRVFREHLKKKGAQWYSPQDIFPFLGAEVTFACTEE